jgi:hypothetical protein
LPSDQIPDFQEKTPSSLSQKISQLDPWKFLLASSEGIANPRDQQSSTDAQHNGKKGNDWRNPIYQWAANYAQIREFRHHSQAGQTE